MKSIHIIILLLAFFALQMNAQSDEVIVPLENAGEGKHLKIDLFQGEINIIGTDRQDILVKYNNTIDLSEEISPPEESEGLKRIGGNNFELLIGSEKNHAFIESKSWNKYLEFEIEVPKNINLNVSKNIGENVIVDNIIGNINIENNVGNVIARNITGLINASTNAGSLEIQFDAIPEPKAMLFNNTTGEIDITLPKDFKADLKMKSQMGEIYSDLEIAVESKVQDGKASEKNGKFRYLNDGWTFAKLNGGGTEVTIKSQIGNIFLRGR